MKLVISQPFFLPWIGLFEQLRLADVFVHFDDVQMQGQQNFIKRVQIKTDHGIEWLIIPIKHIKGVLQKINDVKISYDFDWRKQHRILIKRFYKNAPYFNELDVLLDELYEADFEKLSDYVINGIEIIALYFGFKPQFIRSSSFHTHDHVLRALKLYAPLVSVDNYCIVWDTGIEDATGGLWPDMPWGKGNNPQTAVWEFLKTHGEFEIDKGIQNKLLITAAPDGYLKRVK